MKEEETNGYLLDGFVLGVRLMQSLHELPRDDRHVKLLAQIAAGEVTLEISTAELRQDLPTASEKLLAQMEEVRGKAIEREQALAKGVLAARSLLVERRKGLDSQA